MLYRIYALAACILSLFLTVAYSTAASATGESDKLIQILGEVDRLENKLKKDADRLEEKVNHNEIKLRKNEKSYSEILEIQKRSEATLAEANKFLTDLKTLQASNQNIRERLTKTETTINNIETQLSETKADVRSSGNVIKWVTAIVSVIVIIAGLFFSKVFLDLYANYQVLKAKCESREFHESEISGQQKA